ncbi:MAG: HAD family phosphatase [Clostridia bacterium]|nr:HAD family phosphatase [Clostridia bacterium]
MKKFEGLLICTDLDGTLLNSQRIISEKNLEAIKYFKSEGGYFTFITGRMPFFAKQMYETVRPNCPFGCINGGGIYDHVKMEYTYTLEISRSVFELVEYIDTNIPEIGIQVNTFDKVYFCRDNIANEHFRMITGMPYLPKNYYDVDEPMAKIIFVDHRDGVLEKVEELLKNHPRANEFDFIRSEKTLFEILPKGSGKGNVLPKLSEQLGIDMKKTIAVGDYHNDISMLKAAGLGIAVSNAQPEVKKAADMVTVSNDEDAISKIISDIDNGFIKL